MTSTFGGLYISLRSIIAQQAALRTANNNVANSGTEGYTRQKAVMVETAAWPAVSSYGSYPAGQVGTGVDVSKITRDRDAYLDVQLRTAKSTQGEWEIKEDFLEQVETLFSEPSDSSGLGTLLSDFWDSWKDLNQNSESNNSAVRTTVEEISSSLADALRNTMTRLESLSEDADNMVEIDVSEVNSIAKQINDLNKQIKTIKTAGMEPNDLLDQRDLLLDDLSELIDYKTTENADGTIDVYLYNDSTSPGSYSSRLVDGVEGKYNTLETKTLDFDSMVMQVQDYSGETDLAKQATLKKLLLEDLSEATGYSFTGTETISYDSGSKTITIDGTNKLALTKTTDGKITITDSTDASNPFSMTKDPQMVVQWGTYTSTDPAGSAPVAGENLDVSGDITTHEISGGELKGLMASRDLLKGYMDDMNTFAANLISKVNAQHQKGYDLHGNLGGAFFTGKDAFDIALSATIDGDNSLIAAATGTDANGDGIISSDEVSSGDGSNALEISNLRSTTGMCDGASFDDYYNSVVSRLGVESSEAQRMADNQETLVGQLEERKSSISGVSTEEEVTHMVEFQHAYEAASRFFTTLDDLLDTLINRMAV